MALPSSRSRQYMQPMHLRMLSGLPALALFMNSGSANWLRPRATKSLTPSSSSFSAVAGNLAKSGSLMVLVAMTGMDSASLKALATCFFQPGV